MFCTQCGTELRAQDCFCSQCGRQLRPKSSQHPRSRLERDTGNKKIAGVAAGLARYFEMDVVLVRILLVVLAFWGGMGLIFYIACWIAMPKGATVEPLAPSSAAPAPAR